MVNGVEGWNKTRFNIVSLNQVEVRLCRDQHLSPEAIIGENGLLKELTKAILERALHWREALNHFTILWPERMPALERVASRTANLFQNR